jgi:hypothetical protein
VAIAAAAECERGSPWAPGMGAAQRLGVRRGCGRQEAFAASVSLRLLIPRARQIEQSLLIPISAPVFILVAAGIDRVPTYEKGTTP